MFVKSTCFSKPVNQFVFATAAFKKTFRPQRNRNADVFIVNHKKQLKD